MFVERGQKQKSAPEGAESHLTKRRSQCCSPRVRRLRGINKTVDETVTLPTDYNFKSFSSFALAGFSKIESGIVLLYSTD